MGARLLSAGVALVLSGLSASAVVAQQADPSWDIIKCVDKHTDRKPAFTLRNSKSGETIVKFNRKMKMTDQEKSTVIGCISKMHPDLTYK